MSKLSTKNQFQNPRKLKAKATQRKEIRVLPNANTLGLSCGSKKIKRYGINMHGN